MESGSASYEYGDILLPWREIERLHELRPYWIDLPIGLPPTLSELHSQTLGLMQKQALLDDDAHSGRKDEILREAELELSGYLRPLGIENLSGYDNTTALFLMVARLAEEVGMRYKERFNVPRPSAVEPRLRTFIPVPAHASWPSNHSLQSFSIAFVFSRVLPEHPGIAELFRSARRIAENREWAGIHYPADTKCGHDLARMLAPVLEVVLEEQMLRARAEWL